MASRDKRYKEQLKTQRKSHDKSCANRRNLHRVPGRAAVMSSRRMALCALGFAFALVPAQSHAQEVNTSPTPSAAPPNPYVSIEEEVSPNYDGESGSSSQINLRGQLPYVAGAQYIFRLRLPIVTSAPATAVTGAGDLALYDLAVIDTTRGRWLEGLPFAPPPLKTIHWEPENIQLVRHSDTRLNRAFGRLAFSNKTFFRSSAPSRDRRSDSRRSNLFLRLRFREAGAWAYRA